MRARRSILCLLAAAALGVLPAAPSAAQAPRPGERIAAGIGAGGIDLSGLTVQEAAAALESRLGRKLARDVVVRAAGRTYRLSARRARFELDAERTARRALYEGRKRDGQPAPPPSGTAGGSTFAVDVGLGLSHARRATRRFAGEVAARSARRARNASVRLTVRRVRLRRAVVGLRIDGRALAADIDRALADPRASRRFAPKRRRVYPPVNADDLRRQYSTVVTIDRAGYRLRLFKRLRHSKTYGIAVGAAGYDTPSGRFRIQSKQVNPPWHAPNRPWAGALAGRTIPGGAPNNPLKARWLGIVNGVGIHGTAEPWSIGGRASHGCIRMKVPDVVDLYPRVPVGTPVLIR